MTPEKTKKKSPEAVKREYEHIKQKMEEGFKNNVFSQEFPKVSGKAIKQLEEDGYIVKIKQRPIKKPFIMLPAKYYEISSPEWHMGSSLSILK